MPISIITDFGRLGWPISLLSLVALFSFGLLSAAVIQIITGGDHRSRWWICALASVVVFAASFTAAAFLYEQRQAAADTDLRNARGVLEGRWTLKGSPCADAETFEVLSKDHFTVTFRSGFAFDFDVQKVTPSLVQATERRGKEVFLYRRNAEILTAESIRGATESYVKCD